jgi:diguanylate cyclase (GGDEF)-like protein
LTSEPARGAFTVDAFAAVRRLSSAVLNASDRGSVYRELANEICAVLGVGQVHIARLSQDYVLARGNCYRPGPDGVPDIGPEYEQQLTESSAVRDVALTGEPLNEPNVRSSAILDQELAERFGAASALFVPLGLDKQVRAVIGCISEEQREFAQHEVELACALANQAAAAIGVLDMRARMSARAEHQTALARAARSLNARLDLQAVLETLCREAHLALGADLAGVYLGDAKHGGLAVAAHGIDKDSDWFGYVIQPGQGVGGQVLVTGQPFISNSYRSDVQAPQVTALEGIETAVAVPVRWEGELKGALSVAFRAMRRVTDEDIASLQALSDLAGVACTNAQAFEHAQTAARTDSLTGLLNHGAVHGHVREEIARARRSGEPLCCLLADLDNFKPINDQHGHLAGDRILKEVAAQLEEEFRAYDGIGRFGGDEFVVVLPGMTEEEADLAGQRFQAAVAAALPMAGSGMALTASVGIARWHEPLTAPELIDRADRALLVAKRSGKNRAVLSSNATEDELARLGSSTEAPTRVLADLWDMISQCDRPTEVLLRLPEHLREALDLAGAVLVGVEDYPMARDLCQRLEGAPIARPNLLALRKALGAWDLPVDGGEGSWAAVPLARDEHVHGLLVLRSRERTFPLSTLRLAELLAGQAVTALVGQMGGASRSAVGALAAAIDARDNYTHSHSEEVVDLAAAVAASLGLEPAEVIRVRDGAMLHDLGKVAIPNEILFKSGPLDADEWAIMREHPVIGERILRRTPELEPIAPMVRHEHERWDGGGYPDGLAGDDIPIGSRIILACDAYNAMITERPYREPMSPEAAVCELEDNAGTQFDPQVIAALLAVLADRLPVARSA